MERVTALADRESGRADVLLVAGQIALECRRFAVALSWLERANMLQPDHPPILESLSMALNVNKRPEEGRRAGESSFEKNPNSLVAALNITQSCLQLEDWDSALVWAERAFALDPRSEVAINNLYLQKRAQDPLGAWRWLRRIGEDLPGWGTLRLAAADSLYLSELEEREVAEVHQLTAGRLIGTTAVTRRYARPLSLDRPVRLGFLGPDFRSHAVASFLLGWLQYLPELNFELEFFSLHPTKDEVTDRFCALGKFHDLADQKAITIVSTIYSASVDVLIELGGYTLGARPEVLVGKPAPIVISAIGYARDLGMDRLDGRLVDPWTDPPASPEEKSVANLMMPSGFLCHSPLEPFPVIDRPETDGSALVFGSFNNAQKISRATLDLWTRVLLSVPDSRLVLKSLEFADSRVADRVLGEFSERGVSGRVKLTKGTPTYQDHLLAYREIDIALDTTPYSGTTTTFEALMMGVPVMTLEGETHRSRVSASILRRFGLQQWVCASPEEFVQRAMEAAGNRGGLIESSREVRNRVTNHAVQCAQSYAVEFSELVRNLVCERLPS